MKHRLIFFLATLALSKAFGQADAGPDQRICPGASTTIGTTGYGSFCYFWEPATGLSDPESPTPTAMPTQTTTYTLTVVAQDLSNRWTDQVTVTVEGIQRITVTPKRCCWKKGEAISESDFDIVTTPPDLKGEITITPSTAPFSILSGGTSLEDVVVKFTCDQAMTQQTVKITVVDEDFKITAANTQFNANKVGGVVSKVCDTANKIGSKLGIVATATGGGCTPQISCTFDIPMTNFGFSKKCCGNGAADCVKTIFKVNAVSGGISAGLNCYFPFAGVPGVASLNFNLQANISGQASITAPGQIDCTNESNSCFKIALAGNFGGGVAGCLGPCHNIPGAPNVIRLQGVVLGSITPNKDIEFCLPNGQFNYPTSICFSADFEGSVTFVSLYSKKFKVGLIPKRCL